jgi:micrococcal nuclease
MRRPAAVRMIPRRSRGRRHGGIAVIGMLSLLAVYSATSSLETAPPPTATRSFEGAVTRVVDGDTLWIEGQSVRIRIWGLDAPETGDAGGAAATAAMARLVEGRRLTCRQRDIDRYGRIVGQCFLPDGRDIARAMMETGTAREYCRFSSNHYGTC